MKKDTGHETQGLRVPRAHSQSGNIQLCKCKKRLSVTPWVSFQVDSSHASRWESSLLPPSAWGHARPDLQKSCWSKWVLSGASVWNNLCCNKKIIIANLFNSCTSDSQNETKKITHCFHFHSFDHYSVENFFFFGNFLTIIFYLFLSSCSHDFPTFLWSYSILLKVLCTIIY